MEVLKVDRKERAVIPAHVRRGLGIRRAVKARVEEGRLIIEPPRGPRGGVDEAGGGGDGQRRA